MLYFNPTNGIRAHEIQVFCVFFPVFGHRKQCLSHMARLPTTAETEAEACANCLAHSLVGLLPSGHSQPVQEHVQDCQISAHTRSLRVLIYTHWRDFGGVMLDFAAFTQVTAGLLFEELNHTPVCKHRCESIIPVSVFFLS